MALAAGEYMENGFVKNADGVLVLTVYDAADVATYYTSNGFLRDADGRLIVVESA